MSLGYRHYAADTNHFGSDPYRMQGLFLLENKSFYKSVLEGIALVVSLTIMSWFPYQAALSTGGMSPGEPASVGAHCPYLVWVIDRLAAHISSPCTDRHPRH